MTRGILVAAAAVLLCMPLFVYSNPALSARHRRQSFNFNNMPPSSPVVEDSSGSGGANNATTGTDGNSQANSNLNNSSDNKPWAIPSLPVQPEKNAEEGEDNSNDGNDDGNPAGKSFSFNGNDDWDKAQTVPTIPVGDAPPDFFSNIQPPVKAEETNATATVRCQLDYCQLYDMCAPNERCEMSRFCNESRCINIGNTTVPITEKPQASTVIDPSSLRPISERQCEGQPLYVCLHGYCSDFNCICDEGWQGYFCELPCTLDCVHGSCLVLEDPEYKPPSEYTEEDMFCNCQYNYEGDRCQRLKPDPEEEARILAIVLSCALAVVLLLAVAIPIILWRMRVIFVLKLVYYFKNFEDNDGKLYDAYVSFSPTLKDEQFVYGLLRPTLENHGKKLYLPARDSPVGDVISDNILNAVEQSRCTIMIISEDYVSNEWNRFEYLIAQHEALKLQQRIIPVILEKVEKDRINKDKSLKNILSSIKCLKYPKGKGSYPNSPSSTTSDSSDCGSQASSECMVKDKMKWDKKEEKFWKRLELTMPKTKTAETKSQGVLGNLTTVIRRKLHSDSKTLESHSAVMNGKDADTLDKSQNFMTINIIDIFEQEGGDNGKSCKEDSTV